VTLNETGDDKECGLASRQKTLNESEKIKMKILSVTSASAL
jgi:hypothetical protein